MADPQTSRVVLYAIDDSPLHAYFVEHSIETLRRHDADIAVRVVLVAGASPRPLAAALDRLRVELVRVAAPGLNPWFHKWFALASVPEARALFVDADTAFFDAPGRIFDTREELDFYAREEVGARIGVGTHFAGAQMIRSKIDEDACTRLRAALGLAFLTFFNTGVMLFNHGAAQRVAKRLDELPTLRDALVRGELPYPWTTYHAADGIAGSLLLAMEGLSCGFLGPRLCSFYTELRSGVVEDPGVLLHTFQALYPFYVADFLGPEALAAYPGPPDYTLEFVPR